MKLLILPVFLIIIGCQATVPIKGTSNTIQQDYPTPFEDLIRTANKPILAAYFSDNDKQYHNNVFHNSLEFKPDGEHLSWINKNQYTGGWIQPVRTYKNPKGQFCREYSQQIHTDGQQYYADGTACRSLEGTWLIERH